MNRVYKVIWSKVRNCYVAVSELAKNHGKDSVRSEKRSLVKGMSALALGIALSLGVTGSVWAETVTGEKAEIGTGNTASGTDSVAIGHKSIASGDHSFAGGEESEAKGKNSFAFGYNVTAGVSNYGDMWGSNTYVDGHKVPNGWYSVAFGNQTKALGNFSFAAGVGSETLANTSFAFGEYAKASSLYSVAMGLRSQALAEGAVAFGHSQAGEEITNEQGKTVTTGKYSFAAGNEKTKATGDFSVALGAQAIASAEGAFAAGGLDYHEGYSVVASGKYSAALGIARAYGDGAFAAGDGALADGNYSTATGSYSKAYGEGSFATGYNTQAGAVKTNDNGTTKRTGAFSAAFGVNTKALGYASSAFGDYSQANGDYSAAFGQGIANNDFSAAFGQGTASGNYSVAFGQGTATGFRAVAMGYGQAEGKNTLAVGYLATAAADESVAFGEGTHAVGDSSVALGSSTVASGEGSIASGLSTNAKGDRSVATGSSTFAAGELSITSGNMTRALGKASVAGGSYTAAYAQNARSFGEYAHAIGKNTTAFGHYTTAGKRLQTEEEKALGIYTMVDPYTQEQIKVTKVNSKQYASMLTDANGTVVTDDDPNGLVDSENRNYIIYHAKRGKWNTGLYAIRVPIKDAQGNPTGEYQIREVFKKENDDTWYIRDVNEQKELEKEAGKPTLLVNYDGVFVTDTSADASNAVAFGNDTEASAANALAFGDATVASNKLATAFGNHTRATEDSATSFGDATLAAGRNATTFGESTVGTMQNATAFGQESAALAKNATAFGVRTKALGQASTTWGDESIAPGKYSTAFGEDSEAFAPDSTAWGSKTVAGIDKNDEKYLVYKKKLANLRQMENDLKLRIKYGQTTNYIDSKTGELKLGSISLEAAIREAEADLTAEYAKLKNLGKAATAFGENTNAIGNGSTAWGSKSVATGKYSTAFGESSKAYGQNSIAGLGGTTGTASTNATGAIAIGKGSVAEKSNNVALGQKAQALGKNSIVIGTVSNVIDENGNPVTDEDGKTVTQGSVVSGENSIAIGSGHTVSGKNSGAFGDPDIVNGDNSYVIGNNSKIDTGTNDAFILGNKASVTASGGVALGTGSVASRGAESKTIVTTLENSVYGYDVKADGAHILKPGEIESTWASTAAAVSVGDTSNNITRRITGVAAGSADTDAVNVAQLRAFTGEAIAADGVHYYSVPDGGEHKKNYDNKGAQGTENTGAMAAGVNTATYGKNNTAVGADSWVAGQFTQNTYAYGGASMEPFEISDAQNSTALGQKSIITGSNNVAIGTNSSVTGRTTRSIQGPDPKVNYEAENSTAVGYNSTIRGSGNTVLGADSSVVGSSTWGGSSAEYYQDNAIENSTAIGYQSKVLNYGNSTVVGAYSYSEGEYNTAIGVYSRTEYSYGNGNRNSNTAIGSYASASGGSVAIGGGDKYFSYYNSDDTGYAAGAGYHGVAIGGESYAGHGEQNVAIGYNSHAVGNADNSSGKEWGSPDGNTGATAIGGSSEANGIGKTAVGYKAASRGINSIAIGRESVAGSYDGGSYQRGDESVSIGHSAKTFGGGSIALGAYATTYGSMAVANGIMSSAGTTNSISIGNNATIKWHDHANKETGTYDETKLVAENSIAIGAYSMADGKDATAVGRQSQALRRNATAYGNNSHANAWNSIAIGNKAIAGLAANIELANGNAVEDENDANGDLLKGAKSGQSAVAVGNRARATKEYTTAVGASAAAEGWHAVAVGDSNRATGRFSTAIGAGWSEYKVMDGDTEESDNDNKEWERTYSSIGANQAGGDFSTAAGYGNKTVGEQSSAFGKDNKVSGVSSLGVGAGNKVGVVAIDKEKGGLLAEKQENTVSGYAVGSYNTITGKEGTNAGAFGASNEVTGDNSYAVGNSNKVAGATSLAFGTGNIITGNRAGAFGDPNTIDGDDSYAVGNNNNIAADAKRSFILGHEATASVADAVALGSTSVAKRTIHNGGGEKDLTNTGFDVTTGTNYAGEDKEKPTWLSTLGAVSVGGTADDTDAKIGTAATQTRQITGVAAGTADTDAVNVAQLKLAVGAGVPANIDTDNRNVSLVNDEENKKQVITSPYIHVDGVKDAKVENYADAAGTNSIAIGYKSQANVVDSVALGSNSVASRTAKNGGAGAGYDVTTGTNYKGENANSPTWTSTLGAISVGGDSADGSIGKAASATRQITGVAAGTADTDAVNVAQLKVIRTHYYSVNTEKVGDGDSGDVYNADDSNYDNLGATGKGALAAGYYTSATGNESTALGNKSLAKGEKSVAAGYKASASGPSSTAYGVQSTAAGEESVAVGLNAHAYGLNSSAMGIAAKAVGDGGLAIGHGSSTDVKAKVIESGNKETAEGMAERANGLWKIEVDVANEGKAPATGGIAIGSYAHTEGTRALAVGRVASAYGENSTAIGLRSSAYGEGSIAFGHGVEAGDKDHPYNKQVEALHNDPTIEYNLDGADGIVDPKNVIGAVAMGSYAKATGRGSLSVGRYSEANSAYSTAMGIRASVDNTATNAIAIGREVTVGEGGENSVAIGKQSTVSGKDSIAIGTGHTITGSNSGAFGDPTVINKPNSYSVGNNNTINSKDTFVLGNNVKTTGDSTVVIGNHAEKNTDTFGANSVSLGADATASVADGVALGSGSVASRDKGNGGAGAGFDVRTGTNYAGDDAGKPTWSSTLAAVSVGGAASDTDAKIGTAATQTRQITGVAAGTADTDAVNVAQLKLAVGGITYTAGDNITIKNEDGKNIINANIDYTATQSVQAGGPGKGSTTFNLKDGNGDDAGTMTVQAGDNVTITEAKDKNNKPIAVINAQNTTYTTNQSVEAGTGWKDGKGGSTTFTVTDSSGNNLKPMTVKAGDNVKITNGANGEAVITGNGLKNDENPVVYDEKTGEGSVTITDQAGNTTKITNIRSLGGEGIADSINYLGDRINHLDNKINKVGAGAAALAGLHPLDFDPDEKWDFSAAAGSYKGEHAVAIGAFYRPNEDTMFSVGGTIGNGNNMVNVGVSWKFGQKNRISANRISSAKEIIELRKNQEDVHSFLADAVAGNQLDLSKIQLFPDVEENHWAYDYVATMAGNGVLEGYPDGYFKGNRNMTRYEMAAVLYRLMQNGARLSDKALTEFAPELDRIRVDTITKHKDGTPHIQRVRTIKERVDEKAEPSSEKTAKKKAKVKVAEKPVE